MDTLWFHTRFEELQLAMLFSPDGENQKLSRKAGRFGERIAHPEDPPCGGLMVLPCASTVFVATEMNSRGIQRGRSRTGRRTCPSLILETSSLTDGLHPKLLARNKVSPPSPERLVIRMLNWCASKPKGNCGAINSTTNRRLARSVDASGLELTHTRERSLPEANGYLPGSNVAKDAVLCGRLSELGPAFLGSRIVSW